VYGATRPPSSRTAPAARRVTSLHDLETKTEFRTGIPESVCVCVLENLITYMKYLYVYTCIPVYLYTCMYVYVYLGSDLPIHTHTQIPEFRSGIPLLNRTPSSQAGEPPGDCYLQVLGSHSRSPGCPHRNRCLIALVPDVRRAAPSERIVRLKVQGSGRGHGVSRRSRKDVYGPRGPPPRP
jgi:hypothetical protein